MPVRTKFGWRPDTPDQRDRKYSCPRRMTPMPVSMDLRTWCPPIWDQGNIGSCTAHAISAALQYGAIHAGQDDKDIVRSRLFIYYIERDAEGTIKSDAGAEIRDGIKCVADIGACDEEMWVYDTSKFTIKPPQKCYDNAKSYEALSYASVNTTLTDMRSCLADGFPFVIGVTVYSSFMSDAAASTGIIPLPQADETAEGGHAILICGYDDRTRLFTFRNSWGTDWGDEGYGYLPYDYLANQNLADDAWTIRSVE